MVDTVKNQKNETIDINNRFFTKNTLYPVVGEIASNTLNKLVGLPVLTWKTIDILPNPLKWIGVMSAPVQAEAPAQKVGVIGKLINWFSNGSDAPIPDPVNPEPDPVNPEVGEGILNRGWNQVTNVTSAFRSMGYGLILVGTFGFTTAVVNKLITNYKHTSHAPAHIKNGASILAGGAATYVAFNALSYTGFVNGASFNAVSDIALRMVAYNLVFKAGTFALNKITKNRFENTTWNLSYNPVTVIETQKKEN